jgi:hypothetical protein
MQSLRLLLHVDPKLAELHLDRLSKALSSLRSDIADAKVTKSRRQLLELLLEASTVVDEDTTAWLSRIESIAVNNASTSEEVMDVVVVSTVDRFSLSKPEAQADFAQALLGSEAWKDSLTLALLVAATAGQGEMDSARREEAAWVLARCLANEDGSCHIQVRL